MFVQACFIRKNSKELQEKLESIGYKICICANFEGAVWINNSIPTNSIHGIGYVDKEMFGADWTQKRELDRFIAESTNLIDCGENEELFLAIAALRDDSDKNQWFTDGENWHIARIGISFEEYFNFWNSNPHKATVQELINHFKNE